MQNSIAPRNYTVCLRIIIFLSPNTICLFFSVILSNILWNRYSIRCGATHTRCKHTRSSDLAGVRHKKHHALTHTFCPECCTVVTHPHIKLSVEVVYSDNSEVPLSLSIAHSLKEQSDISINSHVLFPRVMWRIYIGFVFVFQEQR